MQLTRLELRNYRCFKSLDLDLDPRTTVLVGENASGKTAVLEALAIGLSTLFRAWPQAPQSPVGIKPEAARLERIAKSSGPDEIYPGFPVSVICHGVLEEQELSWARELPSVRSRKTTARDQELGQALEKIGTDVANGVPARLPLVAYFGTQRLWLKKKDTELKKATPNRFAGFLDCLDPASNLKHWRDWMYHQTVAELQDGIELLPLRAVQKTVAQATRGAERFYFDVKNEELRIVWKTGRVQPFDELSDGYRNFVGILADLAWRAAVLNPRDGLDAPRNAVGVVLIDEIDLHLHPGWQREVLGALSSAFPNLQFVVTTHSPQVIGSSQGSQIRILDGTPVVGRVRHALGWDSNEVLRKIMGTSIRDERAQGLFAAFESHIETGDWLEAEARVDELGALLGDDNPDVMGASWTLRLERGDSNA